MVAPLSMAPFPFVSSRTLKGVSSRSRLVALVGATLAFLFLIHLLFPSSNRFLAHTQRWTTASSSVIRSKFLRAKAKAPRPAIIHPIPKLMADAKVKYDGLLKRQSRTLSQAVAEYERRYNQKPPKGFGDWFQFAKDNGAMIIDEYDQLHRDLTPFSVFSGAELRRRCIQVGFLPSVDLVRVENGQTRTIDVSKGFDDAEVRARAKGFRVMLEKFQRKLPDMDFPINEKAEGRILVPWEEKLYHNLTVDSTGALFQIWLGSIADKVQTVSNTFSEESLYRIGVVMAMFGKLIVAPVILLRRLVASLALSELNSKRVRSQSPGLRMLGLLQN